MADTKKTDDSGIRSFGVFLQGLADGEAELELSDALHELLQQSMEEAKARNSAVKAKLNLEITIQADPRDVVAFGYDIKRKEPQKQRAGTTMFVTKRGLLTLNNPRQCQLPLREVKQPEEARDVDADTTAREV